MTRDQLLVGLQQLVERLSAGDDTTPPPEFEPHEWSYVKGLASGAVLQLATKLRDLSAP